MSETKSLVRAKAKQPKLPEGYTPDTGLDEIWNTCLTTVDPQASVFARDTLVNLLKEKKQFSPEALNFCIYNEEEFADWLVDEFVNVDNPEAAAKTLEAIHEMKAQFKRSFSKLEPSSPWYTMFEQ